MINRNLLLLVLTLLLSHCASHRKLSPDEMKLHNLTGQLSNAEICPTRFDEKTQTHVRTGECEWVRCEDHKGQIQCRARKKPFTD